MNVRKITLVVFLLFSFLAKLSAQLPMHYVNYTGGDNYIPFNFMYNKVQWLYYPSDLTNTVPLQAGFIEKIYVKAALAVNVTIPSVTIKIGTTNLTAVTNGPWVGGLTTVLSATSFQQTSVLNQWVAYTLTTPYYYDGVSNFILEIEVTPTNAGGYTVFQGYPGLDRRMYGLVGSAASVGIDGTQAAIGFDLQSDCNGMPSAGYVTKSSPTIHCGDSVTATLNSYTSANGIETRWERSFDKVNWTAGDTGATVTYRDVQQKLYFRCKVTCLPTNQSTYSFIDSVVVVQIPFSLGVDTHLCQLDTITLNAVLPNATTYLWQDNSTTTTYKVTQSGTYAARVNFANGCISKDTIVIRDGVLPINPLVSNYDLCEDSLIVLHAQNANMTYLWSSLDTTSQISVRTPGTHSVTITSRDLCKRTFTAELIQRPLPIVTLSPEYLICIGEPLMIDGTAIHGVQYYWNDVLGNPVLQVVDSGIYNLQVRSAYGCLATDETHITYKPDPIIGGFTFIPNLYVNQKEVQFAVINPQNVNSVKWYFGDGDSSTLLSPVHVYDELGVYEVRCLVINNCNTNVYNQTINLVPNSIYSPELAHLFSVYPNPANQKIFVKNGSNEKIATMQLYDVLGRYYDVFVDAASGIDITQLSSGTYYLHIQMDNGNKIVKPFVKE